MPLYEHVLIARQDISPQQVDALTSNLKEIIESGGGNVSKIENWGLRSLAYRIKKNRKGHYALLNIDAPHEAVAEMERQMSINEDVLRILTLRVDEHEAGESAIISSRGARDDRRPRGDRDRGDRDRGDRQEKPAHKSDDANKGDAQ